MSWGFGRLCDWLAFAQRCEERCSVAILSGAHLQRVYDASGWVGYIDQVADDAEERLQRVPISVLLASGRELEVLLEPGSTVAELQERRRAGRGAARGGRKLQDVKGERRGTEHYPDKGILVRVVLECLDLSSNSPCESSI